MLISRGFRFRNLFKLRHITYLACEISCKVSLASKAKQSRQMPLKFVHWRFFHEMKKGHYGAKRKLRRSLTWTNFISWSVRFFHVLLFYTSVCPIAKAATKTFCGSDPDKASSSWDIQRETRLRKWFSTWYLKLKWRHWNTHNILLPFL